MVLSGCEREWDDSTSSTDAAQSGHLLLAVPCDVTRVLVENHSHRSSKCDLACPANQETEDSKPRAIQSLASSQVTAVGCPIAAVLHLDQDDHDTLVCIGKRGYTMRPPCVIWSN